LQPLSAALLCFSPASLLLDIRYIDASTDWPYLIAKSTAEAERGYVHLLVRPSLIAEFGIRVQDTNLHIHEAGTLYLPDQALWPKAGNPATGEQLVSAILQQQDGEGLRSHYPYAYVWYHNLLYLVTKISIPGFAASRACDAQVFDTCIRLRESGYRPFQVEAIYPRPFLSSIYKTTAQHTWFGIRLAQNFCQYRHQMGRLANGGR
jgi:hypothetical protein